MAGKLRANVVVGGVMYGPDSDVPADVAAQITNPKAWAEQPVSEGEGRSVEVPPRAGKGSSREAWAEYAAAVKVDVDDDATRDDIIAAVEAAGVPTE